MKLCHRLAQVKMFWVRCVTGVLFGCLDYFLLYNFLVDEGEDTSPMALRFLLDDDNIASGQLCA